MSTDVSPFRADVGSLLQHLIETCEDGARGFREAADLIDDHGVKMSFQELGDERERCAAELRELASRRGVDTPETGMVKAAAHRAWMNIKDTLTGGDTHAVVSAAEEGEDYALEQYDEALEQQLPDDVREVVVRQRATVKAAHDRVRSMKNLTE